MGKISNYARVLAAKLQDVFVCDQTDSNVTSTKSVTVEQIGDAICGEQVHADLETDDQTIIGGINENKDKVGDLSTLTTSQKDNLVKAINEIATYTPVYGNTASGAIATFDTSLALPLQDCTIAINAVQEEGTPAPSSPKAISGFTGANITNHGKNYLDTSTNVNGKALSATGAETSVPAACYTDLIKVVGGEKYTFGATSALVDAWNRRIHGYDVSGNWVQEIMNSNAQSYAVGTPFTMTFTVPSGISYIRISYYKDTNAQLEKGESASAYQAYNSTTYPVSWNDEAGTVYGGSLDVTSGVLTVTHGIITFDGSGDEIWNDGTIRYSIEIPDCERIVGRLEVLCNRGAFASSGGSEGTVFATNKYLYYYPPTSITSLADFKTWLGSNNLVVVYPLETPTTYQLTPTQISAIVGTNNIFTDTNGNTSVVYACSLKDYIDGQ